MDMLLRRAWHTILSVPFSSGQRLKQIISEVTGVTGLQLSVPFSSGQRFETIPCAIGDFPKFLFQSPFRRGKG